MKEFISAEGSFYILYGKQIQFIINKDCEFSEFSVPLHPKIKTRELK